MHFWFPHPNQPRDTTWSLVLVRDNATDEVGLCGPQVGHELVEVLLGVGREGRRHGRGREPELDAAVDRDQVRTEQRGPNAPAPVLFLLLLMTLHPPPKSTHPLSRGSLP